MFPGARDLQLCYNEARVCTTVRRAKQRVYIVVVVVVVVVFVFVVVVIVVVFVVLVLDEHHSLSNVFCIQ